jgi:hypothetical protein
MDRFDLEPLTDSDEYENGSQAIRKISNPIRYERNNDIHRPFADCSQPSAQTGPSTTVTTVPVTSPAGTKPVTTAAPDYKTDSLPQDKRLPSALTGIPSIQTSRSFSVATRGSTSYKRWMPFSTVRTGSSCTTVSGSPR